MQKRPKTLIETFTFYLRVLVFCTVRVILSQLSALESIPTAIRSRFHPNNVCFEKGYEGENVLLIALYQKGVLRPDLVRLLSQAKQLGFYTVGVNNSKIGDKQPLKELLSCYIERFNYGRDFGSYQTGLLHLFEKGIQNRAKNLLILNDSVYYESTKVATFLDELMNGKEEVLGATENHEFDRHLGSFCIAVKQSVLSSPRFIHFWKKYRKTDVRPWVINRGELALSKLLRQIVSNPDQFRSQFDSAALVKWLSADRSHLNKALKFMRRLEPKQLWQKFLSDHYFNVLGVGVYPLHHFDGVLAYFQDQLKIDDPELASKMESYLVSKIVELFTTGSQIHYNNPLLLEWGLPIIKLDGIYRGVFLPEDVTLMRSIMNAEEGDELHRLLFAKAYGGATLFGLNRLKFRVGCL